jgi:xylulokinase
VILAFDIGTSSVKGGIFSGEGAPLARAEVPVRSKQGRNPLEHEVEAGQWIEALRSLAGRLKLAGKSFAALLVSGNGPTLVPVAASGRCLLPAMTWMDRRAQEEAALIASAAGRQLDASFYLPKAVWIQRRRPEIYKQTAYFLTCPDYIDYVLTGEALTVLPDKGFSKLLWEPDLLAALNLEAAKFPPFVAPGVYIGRVTEAGAEATSLPRGTPVYSGGPDFSMSLLGTGAVRPGRACLRSGTSEGLNLCTEDPVSDRRLISLPHIVPPYHNVSGIVSTSGAALDWLARVLGSSEPDYRRIFAEIQNVPEGARRLLFLPYLAGERSPHWDPLARGSFIGLTLRHGRAEMLRAAAEAVGFALRDIMAVMEENHLKVRELRVTGGQARSGVWNQIKADITQRRLLLPDCNDSELLGAACLGLAALKRHSRPAEAAEAVVKIAAEYEPRPQAERVYSELFHLYQEAYSRLKELFVSLGDSDKGEAT